MLCASERNTRRCPEGLERAAAYLTETLAGLGYGISRQEYPADGVTCVNLDAVAPDFVGRDRPHYIVGAHYDSAPGTPGADDNASAVAILLEIARRLAGRPCAKYLRFVAYTNEEPPHFYQETMGSIVHARACRDNEDALAGMICLESLGIFSNEPGSQQMPEEFNALPWLIKKMLVPKGIDPVVGNFLVVIGNGPSATFLRRFTKYLEQDADLPVVATDKLDIRLSDHLAYWEEGFPAIMLTDTALYRNRHYHQATDTPDKLDYRKMVLLTGRIATAIEALDFGKKG